MTPTRRPPSPRQEDGVWAGRMGVERPGGRPCGHATSTPAHYHATAPPPPSSLPQVRKATNNWVAKYRRDASFSGKPSYGTTYSALNAVAGHFNSFGADAPLPKKRLERVIKELDDADKLLARGR